MSVSNAPGIPTNAEKWPDETLCRRLFILGLLITAMTLWNGVCDMIYGYSATLSGLDYFSSEVFQVILSAGGRSHDMVLLAQTAAWLYPIFALSYYHWWVGMRPAGFWLGSAPNLLLAYAVLMIGGIQHAGWAFLSVLEQARAVTGNSDADFFALANHYIIEHFLMGDATAIAALYLGAIWHAVAILSGRTAYPKWFVCVSPLGVLVATITVGVLSPPPYAGWILAPFGTWFLLVPTLATTVWLRKVRDIDKSEP